MTCPNPNASARSSLPLPPLVRALQAGLVLAVPVATAHDHAADPEVAPAPVEPSLTHARRAPEGLAFVRMTTGEIVNDGGFSFGHAWGDLDGDDCPDLVVNNIVSGQANLVYVNDCDGTFTKTTTGALVELGPSTSSSWGDYDGDGHLDLFVANGGTGGSKANYLYHNEGDGSFTKITTGALVTQVISSTATSWVDVDGDGMLDLFVGRSGGGANQLFFGHGDGTFTETFLPDTGGTWGVSFADVDDDGDMDAFCANWQIPNYLYRNDGGALVRLGGSVVAGANRSLSGSFGDYDGDLDLDLFVANSAAADRLFRNEGGFVFVEISGQPMTTSVANSEGSTWDDLDNDGDLDLLISAGGNQSVGMNALYTNDGDGTFTEVTAGELVTTSGRYEGVTTVDMDRDGDLDVFLSNYSDLDNVLYRHEGASGAFVSIRCVGQASNRSAIGARVEVLATIEGRARTQLREITRHRGHVAESEARVHVGLGDAKVIDRITIRWPAGGVDVHEILAVNGFYTFVEGVTVSVDAGPGADQIVPRAVPTPFRDRVVVALDLPDGGEVTFAVFDVHGREIERQRSGWRPAGTYTLAWDGRVDGVPATSGVYPYRVDVERGDGRRQTARGRLVLAR